MLVGHVVKSSNPPPPAPRKGGTSPPKFLEVEGIFFNDPHATGLHQPPVVDLDPHGGCPNVEYEGPEKILGHLKNNNIFNINEKNDPGSDHNNYKILGINNKNYKNLSIQVQPEECNCLMEGTDWCQQIRERIGGENLPPPSPSDHPSPLNFVDGGRDPPPPQSTEG